MHWRDLDSSDFLYTRHGVRSAVAAAPYPGLHVTIDSPTRPMLRFEFASPLLFRLVIGTSNVLWGRIDDWWSSTELVRDAPLPGAVVPPLRAQDIDGVGASPRTTDWYAHWSRAFARELASSPLTPLHVGAWRLLPRTEPTSSPAPWPPRCSFESPRSREGVAEDELGPDATDRPLFVNYCDVQPAPLIRLRPPGDADDSRVKMWRRRARDGSLPPLLALFVSPIGAYLLLDGHDRLAAARAERVSPPLLTLFPVRERAHTEDPETRRAALEATIEMQKQNLPTDVLNRIVTAVFDDRPRSVPLTRVWPLAGGVAAWRDGALRAAQRMVAADRESLVFGI